MKSASASSTAKVIAAATILLDAGRHSPNPVAPGAAELCHIFLSGTRADRLLAASAAHPLTRRLWQLFAWMVGPGIVAHYWNRKRWIENRCRGAISAGVDTVAILGAGFDTLGIRLAREFPALLVMEIDHPATQAVKLQTIVNHQVPLPPNLRFLTADLSKEPPPVRAMAGKSTLIIMEGLLMYFPAETVSQIFRTLRETSASELQIIFTYMKQQPDGSTGFQPRGLLVKQWLRWRDEPFVWSLPPAEIDGFLAARDFQIEARTSARELVEQAGNTGVDGEALVHCRLLHRAETVR